MKQTFFALLCTTMLFAACGNDNSSEKNAIDTNPTDIAETLHSFFSWYGDNADRIENNGFTAEKGGHRVLDEAKFKQYLAELKNIFSGFSSANISTGITSISCISISLFMASLLISSRH